MGKGVQPNKNTREIPSTSFIYAVQCGKCFKWRQMPTREEFEDIRSTLNDDPFFCDKRPDVTCEDPADIEYDTTRIWIADKRNIPKTPEGFQRGLVLRKTSSRLDVHYVTPTGKKVRAPSEVAAYLEQNPENNNASVSEFSFAIPKIMDDSILKNMEDRVAAGSAIKKRKRRRTTKYKLNEEVFFLLQG